MRLRAMTPVARVERVILTKSAGGCDCWRLTLRERPDGYVRISVKHRLTYAHRYSFEAHRGPVPDGFELDHLCRNRWCANPDHLEVVTRAVNMARSIPRCSKLTHCKRGHPLSGPNVYRAAGKRLCRTCRRAMLARRKAA